MLHLLKDLRGLSVAALDQQVGDVKDVLFDDLSLTVRYFVVKTGGWLSGREVLISSAAIKGAHPERGVLVSSLNRKQIEESPPLEAHPPVSRQYEELLHKHYEWAPYWGVPGATGYGVVEVPPPNPRAEWQSLSDAERSRLERLKTGDPHLQSAREVDGYALRATDGDVGHVKDFLVDTTSWQIKYFVVQAGHWFASRKVVIDRTWVREIQWADRDIVVALNRSDIEHAPPYDAEALGATYESDLTVYYKGLFDRWRARIRGEALPYGGSNESPAGHP